MEAGESPCRKHQTKGLEKLLVGESEKSVERRNEPKGRQGIKTSFKKLPAIEYERGERNLHDLLSNDDFTSY